MNNMTHFARKAAASLLALFFSCAAMPAQETATPVEPVEPAYPTLPIFSLRKGYATDVSLMKLVGASTSAIDRSCTLVVADTLDVHFKLNGFSYNRGLGDPFPAGESHILLRLYEVLDKGDSLIARLPFRVDGSTMRTYISEDYERQDSVILSIPPGEYLLEYDGFSDRIVEVPDIQAVDDESGAIAAGASNSEALSCRSSLSLSLECIPLLSDSYVATSWNNVTVLTSRDGGEMSMMTTVTWLDDFGREESVHQVGFTPSHKTLVSLTEYDGHGRVSKRWLPALATPQRVILPGLHTVTYLDAHVRPEDIMPGSSEANLGDGAPYSEVIYDGSPLDRPLMEYGSGEAWRQAGRGILSEHMGNSAGDERLVCHRIEVQASKNDTSFVISSEGLYPDGSLKVVSVTDEDGKETLTFTDRHGREILSRQVMKEGGECQYLDTYSVYDGLDHLLAVIPPALSDRLSIGQSLDPEETERYAYLYLYDSKERVCARKLPGIGWIRMEYDDADRLVFTQDGEQRRRGESTFMLYDIHGRECVTGVCGHDVPTGNMISGFALAEYVGAGGALDGYACSGVTLVSPQVMSAFYYDSHAFVDDFATGLPDSLAMYGTHIPSLIGRRTGSCLHEVSEGISGKKVWGLVRYDGRGRVSHTEMSYPDGGWDTEDVVYDFLGSPVRRHLVHRRGTGSSSMISEDLTYTYDDSERLLEVHHSLNGGTPILLARNTYDELGRLSGTERGSNDALSSTYSYNVRSWLTGIDGSLFKETLHYNELRSDRLGTDRRRFGGDVSSMEWRSGAGTGTRSYDFAYDGLGRLVSADYGEHGDHVVGYGTSYSYDNMGNLLSLSREGDMTSSRKGIVDNLSMTYDGNRLASVSDSAPAPSVTGSADFRDGVSEVVEYTYDRNGNMTSDLNRKVSLISYNRQNRPARMRHAGGTETFTYLPDGTKRGRTVLGKDRSLSRTEYRGNLVCADDTLKYILFDGGLIAMDGASPEYLFFLRDHLGSVRVVARSNGKAVLVNHYYPYGMAYASGRMSGNAEAHPVTGEGGNVIDGDLEIGGGTGGMELARPGASQPYRFLGNELYTSNSLGLYDFSARMYDPALGRFLSVDPMAERYSRVIPYGYCGGNPIRLVDQSGYDWRDKVAGFLIGTATNIIPASSWRDAYNPNDIYDYNAGLQVADNVLKATGGAMVAIGIAAQTFGTSGEVGGLVASTSVVGAPGGLVIAGAGAATVAVGDATALFGSYMMSNVSQNEKDGYLRGKNASSSREARREAMRQEGIPTSQQPTSQSRNASGREYRYEIETSWGKKIKSVQQQTMDSSHPGQQHWEAGDVKMKDGQIRYNKYDRPRLVNSKSKVDY